MSGETEGNVSGWTVDTLRAHFDTVLRDRDLRFDQRFRAQQEAIAAALTSAEKAVSKAEAASERRFEGVNEFRQTLSDQAATLASKVELSGLRQRLDDLAARLDRIEGKSAGLGAAGNIVVAVILAAAAIIGIIIGTR